MMPSRVYTATVVASFVMCSAAAVTRPVEDYVPEVTYTYRIPSKSLSELLKSYGASGVLALLSAYASQALEQWLKKAPVPSPTEVLENPRKGAAKWLSVPVIMKLAPLGMIKLGSELLRALGIDPADEFTSYTLEQAFELML